MKKIVGLILLLPIIGLYGSDSPSFKERFDKADTAFSQQNWKESLDGYGILYESGRFSERSLYRMAWMYEQQGDYAMAIYFLKKADREFGGAPLIQDKIKQLMLLLGQSNFYSGDPIRAVKDAAGWVFLLVFATCILWYFFHYLYRFEQAPVWRKNLNWLVHTLFLPLTFLIVWQVFFPAQEAVIIRATSFYAAPAYGAHPQSFSLGMGETVKITRQEDIWVEISVGNEIYWVPEFTVKYL